MKLKISKKKKIVKLLQVIIINNHNCNVDFYYNIRIIYGYDYSCAKLE